MILFSDLGSPKIAENINFEELDKLLPPAEVISSHEEYKDNSVNFGTFPSNESEQVKKTGNKLYPDLSSLTCD